MKAVFIGEEFRAGESEDTAQRGRGKKLNY